MNYKNIYDKFIADRRIKEASLTGYSEKHHIIPRSLGGDNSPENLIDLAAGDHYFAHLLLAKVYGGKMWQALFIMSQEKTTSAKGVWLKRRWYEVARKNSSKLQKESWKDDNKRIARIENIKKSMMCDVLRKNLSIAKKGDLNPSKRKDVRNKISATLKGTKLPKEVKNKIAENNPKCKKVVNLTTGEVYFSIGEARRKSGVEHIASVCLGNRKQAGGFKWAYA